MLNAERREYLMGLTLDEILAQHFSPPEARGSITLDEARGAVLVDEPYHGQLYFWARAAGHDHARALELSLSDSYPPFDADAETILLYCCVPFFNLPMARDVITTEEAQYALSFGRRAAGQYFCGRLPPPMGGFSRRRAITRFLDGTLADRVTPVEEMALEQLLAAAPVGDEMLPIFAGYATLEELRDAYRRGLLQSIYLHARSSLTHGEVLEVLDAAAPLELSSVVRARSLGATQEEAMAWLRAGVISDLPLCSQAGLGLQQVVELRDAGIPPVPYSILLEAGATHDEAVEVIAADVDVSLYRELREESDHRTALAEALRLEAEWAAE